MNLSERYFHEWAEQPDGGCPTLEEYADAFRELERRAAVALQRQQMENYRLAVVDAERRRAKARPDRYPYPQYGSQHIQGKTYLGQVLGRSGFARLLMNAEGKIRVVESSEEQIAKADGWQDPNLVKPR